MNAPSAENDAARRWARLVDEYRDADTIDQTTTDELVRVGNLLLGQIEAHRCVIPAVQETPMPSAEKDAPVYGCCRHCTDHDAGREWCGGAPHDDPCVQMSCSGSQSNIRPPFRPLKGTPMSDTPNPLPNVESDALARRHMCPQCGAVSLTNAATSAMRCLNCNIWMTDEPRVTPPARDDE